MLLRDLARQSDGRVEIIIRGRPALDQIEDFHEIVASTPGLKFLGGYDNPKDLAAIYGGVDFVWAIDLYEEGLNSTWLLPNRLYEGCHYGVVPLALSGVETSRTLQRLKIGVSLPQPLGGELAAYFSKLTPELFATLKRDVIKVPQSTWIYTQVDCANLTAWFRSFVPCQGNS